MHEYLRRIQVAFAPAFTARTPQTKLVMGLVIALIAPPPLFLWAAVMLLAWPVMIGAFFWGMWRGGKDR